MSEGFKSVGQVLADGMEMRQLPCCNPWCENECLTMVLDGSIIKRECDTCLSVKKEQEANQIAEQEKSRLKTEWEKICPPLYRGASLQGALDKRAAEKVLQWNIAKDGKGLVLHGETGSGKSCAAYMLLSRLHYMGRNLMMFDAGSFGHQVSGAFGDQKGPEFLHRVTTCDVVFLDDFGQMVMTPRVQEAILFVFEARAAYLRPVILTTQFVGEALKSKFEPHIGEAIIRRIRAFSDSIMFKKDRK